MDRKNGSGFLAMNRSTIWFPYCGAAPVPGEWLQRWNFDPILLVMLGLLAWAYISFSAGPPRRRARFALAFALLLILFISPFCALSSALFSARVVHHVLLSVAVAPLIVASVPPDRLRLPGSLGLWTAIQAIVFWLWHAPPVYAWALSGDAAYWLMQLSLLATAIGFWNAIRRSSAPAAAGALLGSTVQMGLLGALITFAGSPLYAPHFLTTQLWGLSPLEDQQLAGLIMWAPTAGVYLAAALVLLGRWIGPDGRPAAAR